MRMRSALPALILALASLPALAAETHTTQKYRSNPAPSAELAYSIRARQSGFALEGDAKVRWQAGEGKYSVATETRARLFGKILDNRSEGLLDDYGLAPERFTEKRIRRDATTTTFARDAKAIRFSASEREYAIKGGEQDRASAVWQLVAVARANAGAFKPGSDWVFFVAGQRDAESWTFRVQKQEKLVTPIGELDTIRVLKAPPPEHQEQQVEVWLAPALDWYPVRIRNTDPDGDFIEQNLSSVNRVTP